MTARAAEVKKGRKFDQVLQGARDVFMRDGFEGASVDEIARVAGVSKATLYSYFSDKRLLFSEVARLECNRQASAAIAVIDVNAPVEKALLQVADRVVRFFLSEFGQQVYRICVAESYRFPELAASQFGELCKSDLFVRRLCGVATDVSEADITRVVDAVVAMFLARYRA